MGTDCRGKNQLLLEVGACWKGKQLSTLRFVREGGTWSFDCMAGVE
jgi:hypothetical protein